ncbi:DNA topoisomerase [Enterococcus sp. AN402]|uniref:type IA DNA topoisomerase n=1 Tax=Enterococcus sp. AN402 TaxID=3151386 RepID=UPI003457F43F
MKLVIAEKPMLARDIARAICGKKVSETAPLPISGNGYTVIGCAGHLLELVEPEELNPKWGKPWDLDVLPIYSHNWKKVPTKDKKNLVDKIAFLLSDASCVIHAGDPDEEGQLIVDEILDYLNYKGKVLRVYVNDNIEKNIVKAFDNLIINESCSGNGMAAYARQMADMCFGINETRLATKRLGTLFTVGRVQTPTLGLVVNRDEAIKNYVCQTFYELTATGTLNTNSVKFTFKPSKALLGEEKHLYHKEVLETLKDTLDGSNPHFSTKVSESRTYPPLPYNLTVLISDMSKRFGMSAARTQQITQDLRDKYKAITYNRSDSQYLKEEHFVQAPTVLSQAMENLGVQWNLDFTIHAKSFNDKNVTAHHGIIPQEVKSPIENMTKDEARVYIAIVERYAMQFLPPAIYDVSTSTFPVENGMMSAVTKRLKDAGYLDDFGSIEEHEEKTVPSNPWIEASEHLLKSIACTIVEKETTPPKPYTEGTLISDMASIAKYVKDPNIKSILKQKDDGKKGEHGGIGTTATRSTIIENLKNHGYLEEKSGKIRSTEKAREFYHLLPQEIRSADVTARWWLIQQDIALGKAGVNELQDNVIEVFQNHYATAYQGISIGSTSSKNIGKCPLCGKSVLQKKSKKTGKFFYSCSENKNKKQDDGSWIQSGCSFHLVSFCGKSFTPKQAKALLSGKDISLKGCTSKKGKVFDCKLNLTKEGKLIPKFQHKI